MKVEVIILLSSLAGMTNVPCEKLWFITDHVYMNVLHASETTHGM